MADPLRGRQIEIGGQQRTIRFSMKALRIAKKLLGGMSLQGAIENLDPPTAIDLASAALASEDSRVTVERVTAWLENEPQKMTELMSCVVFAIGEAYTRMAPQEVQQEMGESLAAAMAATSGTDGPTSSGSSD